MYLLAASERVMIDISNHRYIQEEKINHSNFEREGKYFAVHVVHLLTQGHLNNFFLGLHCLDVCKKPPDFSCQRLWSKAFNLQTLYSF